MASPPELCLSDEQLVRRAQGGCAASFEELLHRYQVPLLHFLQQRDPGGEAEDALQEAFVRAYRNLGRYRPDWPFSTWLFTIARRVSLNQHRRRRPAAAGDTLADLADTEPGPMEAASQRERRDDLWSVARRLLSEEQYTALWLHYVEGLAVGQVARVLGRSWVGVKTMMFRARRTLAPHLGAHQPVSRNSPQRRELAEPLPLEGER